MAKRKSKAIDPFIADLQRQAEGWIPVGVASAISSASEPPSLLAGLSAERIHSAVSAAESGDTTNLFSIYRDALIADTHLAGEIDKRFIAILGDDPVVKAKSDKPEDILAADVIARAIDRVPDFIGMCADLLWGTMWPLAMVERTYKRAESGLGLTWDWHEFIPVPDHLLTWPFGELKIREVNQASGMLSGQCLPVDARRYITHRGHLMRTPDNWGGPMRALVWWFFLKVMDREWWVRFLDKFGTPFTVAKFDKNDDKSRQILERAFNLSARIGGLVVTKDTQIDLIQATTQGNSDAFKAFHDTCNREMSKRIVGQTLSADAQSTGMNSGNAALQGEVRSDIAQFDKKMLSQTLRHQLFRPLLRMNGLTGAVPDLMWGQEEPEENSATATTLAALKTAGIVISDSALAVLSKRMGLDLQRDLSAPRAGPPPGKALSAILPADDPVPQVSREAAAELLRVFSGGLAPIRSAVLSSETPQAAQAAILKLFPDWTAERVAEVVETALAAGAWNSTAEL